MLSGKTKRKKPASSKIAPSASALFNRIFGKGAAMARTNDADIHLNGSANDDPYAALYFGEPLENFVVDIIYPEQQAPLPDPEYIEPLPRRRRRATPCWPYINRPTV